MKPDGPPLAIHAYTAATWAFSPFARGALQRRAARGKEDPARLDERLATAPVVRPEGRLVWLHAASVGEGLVAVDLARALLERDGDMSVLVSTGTVTSARLLAERLPAGARHVCAPVDLPGVARRFMTAWRPDLAVFVEGEIWPNLLGQARRRGVPLALVNARIGAASARSWSQRPAAAGYLFGLFDLAIAADTRSDQFLRQWRGPSPQPPGNLKLAARLADPDPAALRALDAALAGRPVWLAASTHAGEEAAILAAHVALRRAAPDTLLILAPRHPDRADEVVRLAAAAGFPDPPRRSVGGAPGPGDGVWIWDTLGELALAARRAGLTFMGGSLVDGVGGHNPVEPILAGSMVVTGAHVSNFKDLYENLEGDDAIVVLDAPSSDELAGAIGGLLNDDDGRQAAVAAGRRTIAAGAAAMARTCEGLIALLNRGHST